MTDCHQLRIAFAGTPDFAVPSLRALIDSSHELVAVYTQPDRPAGRGRKTRLSPVKSLALEHGLPVMQPSSLRGSDVQLKLRELGLDIMVVVAYGLLLPPEVLAEPRFGCVNIHGSLLPRWRGAAPLHRAVLAGDTVTGITIMHMDEGLDTGPMLARESVEIDSRTTTAMLHDQLAELGAATLVTLLPDWCAGNISALQQDDAGATYAEKLRKSESVINWSESAIDIDRRVRAFNPWPVAQTSIDSQTLRVWESVVADYPVADTSVHWANRTPGTVLSCDRSGIKVVTGDGLLDLLKIQLPGKRPMSSADFANGRDITAQLLGASMDTNT